MQNPLAALAALAAITIHCTVTAQTRIIRVPTIGLADLNGRLVFGGPDAEPWSTDGPGGRTAQLRDIQVGSGWSLGWWDSQLPGPGAGFTGLVRGGGELFFFAFEQPGRLGLWKTDGTAAGTIRVHDHGTIQYGLRFGGAPLGGSLVYAGGRAYGGLRLWRTNTSGTGAASLGIAVPVSPYYFHPFGRQALFGADNTSLALRDLWITNGTAAGTRSLGALNPGLARYTASFVDFRGAVYLTGYPESGNQATLYRITSNGTVSVVLQFTPPTPTNIFFYKRILAATRSHLYLLVANQTGGIDLLQSDGTAAGTRAIAPNVSTAAYAEQITPVGDRVFFLTYHPKFLSNRTELWAFDEATRAVARMTSMTAQLGLSIDGLTAFGSRHLVFSLFDPPEPWVSDGTATGTRQLVKIHPSPTAGSNPRDFVASGGLLYLYASDNSTPSNKSDLFAINLGATNQQLGPGCTLRGLAPTLTATDPVLGRPMQLRVTDAGPSLPGVMLVGLQSRGRVFGAGGCSVYVDLTATIPVALRTSATGSWDLSLTVPNNPGLIGQRIVCQAGLGPTSNTPYGTDLTSAVLLYPGR